MRKKIIIALCLVALLSLVIGFGARGPDFTLSFSRDVPLAPEHLPRARKWLENPLRWPDWIHSGSTIEWSTPQAAHTLTPGAQAQITVDPKKTSWKRYQISLTLLAVERTPDTLELRLRLDGDSKGKIQKVFRDILITVRADRTGIHGSAQATTLSWRSRLTARLSDRSVMNQIFYPHLFKLARLADGSEETFVEGKKSLY